MKNRIIEGKNVYVLITHKNFDKLPAYIQDDILFFSTNLISGSPKKSIKKMLHTVLKEEKLYVKYKNGQAFRIFTEEEMKNYKIERADSFALMSVELTEEMVKDFGKGKIEPHKDNLSVMCLNELYKLDKLDVSSCKFFDLNLSNVCY
jgi:hypothetical protein